MTFFQSKIDFLSANSRFAVQNDGTYLPRITRETCSLEFPSKVMYAEGGTKFDKLAFRDNWAILQPQSYRLHRFQPKHI
jgi:hypothetical protein